jgi:hypothetical protein
MTEILLPELDVDQIAGFGHVPLLLRHAAHRSDLFTDERLARLIEGSQRENYYVNTTTPGATDKSSRREGDLSRLRIWILLLQPEKVDPEYGELLERIYVELSSRMPTFSVKKKKISVLISSPGIPVFYHCDLAGQTLWQVRGEKTVFVYPAREPYLPQTNLEKIVLNEAHEVSLPYDPGWDAAAETFTIQPGDMLHWPLNAPHRVQNGDSVNVSFTTEHVTADVRRTYVVNYANGILRRTLGLQQLSQSTKGMNYWAKYATLGAARMLQVQKGREQTFRIDFTVDPNAPGGFRDIPAYEYRK